MPAEEQQPIEQQTQERPKRRHTGVFVVVGIVAVIVIGFLWRMTFYYIQIQKGNVEPPRSFVSSITFDAELEAAATTPLDPTVLATLATDDDPSLGSTDTAILTVVEFADFGCPFSREASYVVRLLAQHTDKVRYVYRDFPIVSIHPGADKAAEAGECAQDQGRFFDYHDKLYQNQFNLSEEALKRYAQEIGLDTRAFDTCLDSGRYEQEVEEDRQAGIAAGVRGTPTFFFNGHKVEGSIPRTFFDTFLRQFAGIDTSVDK